MRLLMEQDMEQTQQENPELEPIKKFLLIQKLTILTVSNSFIDFINQQLSQGIENAKQGQNAEG